MEMPDYKAYENFSSRDFICNPAFQEWIIEPTAERVDFWKEFLLQYPAATEQVQVARSFLERIAFREEFPDEAIVAAAFEKHLQAVAAENSPEMQPTRGKVRRLWKLAAAAVVAGILLTVAATWYISRDTRKLYQTQYGRTENIVLPDGSTVTLNANSTLQYIDDWHKVPTRDVWLRGEGFFTVRKAFQRNTQALQKFRVHTADLTVEVLGTSFDIRERRGITEVVLGSGKIELFFRNPAHKNIVMKPGDRVVYDPRQQQVLKDTTNAADYSAWQHNKLILKNPTVQEITRYLEDNFGYRIVLEDPRMGSKTINGPILYDSLNDALFILSTVLNTQVIKKDSTIILRPR
ncbi:hypothetical protein HB364_25420 [Pseudoflavitalea sp. X16]|uniref:FecR domain-containing protein n=1 Tax=Paraflavitalea devenefica TaxID=2716334 RepID=UPI00141DD18D|nr:FecR domain-containing protein [Paraflavitalea devenefica]NII28448.1 hypothetical protein [Paraflavitalea devenefica]